MSNLRDAAHGALDCMIDNDSEKAKEIMRKALAADKPATNMLRLLELAEVEMRYAGWPDKQADNPGRLEVYQNVVLAIHNLQREARFPAPAAEPINGEPVAWDMNKAYAEGRSCYENFYIGHEGKWRLFNDLSDSEKAYWVAKAAFKFTDHPAPPAWQGLTDEGVTNAANAARLETMVTADDYIYVLYRAFEAALKEKNHG